MRSGTGRTLLVLLLLTACTRDSRMQAPIESEVAQTKDAPATPPAEGRALGRTVLGDAGNAATEPAQFQFSPIASTTMIIRSGTASIAIDSLETAIGRVRALAARVGGYVANSEIQAVEGGVRSAVLEIKVPAERFDDLVNGLSPLGKVEQVNVSAQDVGEEFTDITARVANGRRLEQRLIELIATRTGKLSDVLEIERELARVREEIERMEGRLRYLQAHSAVSTLSIRVHEPTPLVGDEGSMAVLAEAFRQAWRNSVSLAASAIAAMGLLLPVALLGVLGVLGIRKAWRRRFA
jgi:hypothetical protein